MSIRLLLAGYGLRLVKNSFIFHYGSKAFQKVPRRFIALLQDNRSKLAEKYGMDLVPASKVEMSLVDMVQPLAPSFSVLEIGCKLGATLARIESLYPGAEVLGIEENVLLARLAGEVTSVICAKFPDTPVEGSFDYVIIDGLLSAQSENLLYQAGDCLKAGGKILASVRNTQCVCELEPGRRAWAQRLTRLRSYVTAVCCKSVRSITDRQSCRRRTDRGCQSCAAAGTARKDHCMRRKRLFLSWGFETETVERREDHVCYRYVSLQRIRKKIWSVV